MASCRTRARSHTYVRLRALRPCKLPNRQERFHIAISTKSSEFMTCSCDMCEQSRSRRGSQLADDISETSHTFPFTNIVKATAPQTTLASSLLVDTIRGTSKCPADIALLREGRATRDQGAAQHRELASQRGSESLSEQTATSTTIIESDATRRLYRTRRRHRSDSGDLICKAPQRRPRRQQHGEGSKTGGAVADFQSLRASRRLGEAFDGVDPIR
jgi:hypothetical protein